jgi:hypothetical protein
MCAPTSETQDRVIEDNEMLQEEIVMMAQEPYISAELDYRLERARAQFGPRRPRGHRVARRRSLHLPQGRRRPLSLA